MTSEAVAINWRPKNWANIKHDIIMDTPLVFSPSMGYTTANIQDALMEKAASAIILELQKEFGNEKTDKTVDNRPTK